MRPQWIAADRHARMAVTVVALLAGTHPSDPPTSGMTIAVTVPATVWNTPEQFAMSVLPDGELRVVDSRTNSPGWTKAEQRSGPRHRLTVTVLS